MDLAKYLEKHPYDKKFLAMGNPENYLWKYPLKVSAEEIWPYLSDSSTFNRMMGLPEMKFEERNGKLFGRAKYGRILTEWEEVPWVWEYARRLRSARIYSKGFARYIRVHYEIERLSKKECNLYVHMGVIPERFYSLLLSLMMRRTENLYRKTLAEIEDSILKNRKLKVPPEPVDLVPGWEKRLDTILLRLEEKLAVSSGENQDYAENKNYDQDTLEKLKNFIVSAPDLDVYRIRPKKLAKEWNVPENKVLSLFFNATKEGLFTFSYDLICPHCRGVREEILTLADVPKNGICEFCDIDFDTGSMTAVEITFHVHPSIRRAEKRMYCSAEPALRPHIKMQEVVHPQADRVVDLPLAAGRYRMRVQGRKNINILDIKPNKPALVKWDEKAADKHFEAGENPEFHLHNPAQQQLTFVVEENTEDQAALRPADIFAFQDFRDFFSAESLAPDIQIDLGVQCILFTDIVGSTQFYQKSGDIEAFNQVHRHFRECHKAVGGHDGALVKTLGDAIMAAFPAAVDGLKAAIELQRIFSKENPAAPFFLRMTLHKGPCLAVNLGTGVDYFGSTVNYCAKMQAVAGAGSVILSTALRHDREVINYLKENSMQLRGKPFSYALKSEIQPVYELVKRK